MYAPLPDVDMDLKELFDQCKLFAYVHHLILRPVPARFVCCFLDTGFQGHCEAHQNSPFRHYAVAALTTAVFFLMPIIYGHSVMEYPCELHKIRFGEGAGTLSSRLVQMDMKCATQDFIRSPWSLVLGPIAYALGWINFKIMLTAAGSWRPWLGTLGPTCYALQVNVVRPRLKNLVVQPARGPGSFEYPMTVFYAVLLQMGAVAVLLRSGVAVVIAYALGRAFLALCNYAFMVSGVFADMVEAELAQFNRSAPGDPLLRRVFLGPVRNSAWITSQELAALWGNEKLRSAAQRDEFPMSMFMTSPNLDSKTAPFSRVPIFLTRMYIPDLNLDVDLLKGAILQGEKRVLVWSLAIGSAETR